MPLPKSLSSYTHVKQILDAALPHAKCTFTLPSPAAAVRWRQEAYYFRRLMQQSGNPIYDNFILKIDGAKIHFEKRAIPGTLTAEDGTEIKPQDADIGGDLSEAEKFAFDFAKKLGLEIDENE